MTCEEALLAISAALDGELSPRERAKLSEHLMQCESCRVLAEDLRVLTDALEDSDREPPAGLAESVRKAVEEEPQPVPAPKKRRPPYLRSLAAMVALCVGLGGIGLFASRGMGIKDGSAGGAAPALYQAPQASQAAPEAMERSADDGCEGLAEDCNGAVRYSATEGGDPTEASMEESDAEAPQLAPANVPMPSSAPSSTVEAEVRGGGGPSSDGGTEEVTPDSSSDGAGPSSDRMEGEGKLAITPEEALELVFQYVGGYTQYPEAQLLSQDGSVLGYILKTVETDSDILEWHLDYAGAPPEGEGYYFHFYKIVTNQQEDPSSTYAPTLDWFTVSPDGRISMKYPMDD